MMKNKFKILSLLLAVLLIFGTFGASAINNEGNIESFDRDEISSELSIWNADLLECANFVPGQLLVGLNFDAHLERNDIELFNEFASFSADFSESSSRRNFSANLFPGVDALSVRDLTDVSDFMDEHSIAMAQSNRGNGIMRLSDDEDSRPPRRQILLIELADDSKEYMLAAIEALEQNPLVAYAEPNMILTTFANRPNDPFFQSGQLWGMEIIQAPEAWNITTGSRDVLVGVIDTGIDYNHPDLAANVDRSLSRNFINAIPNRSHGTAVAGVIGAVGDNEIGVVGVNWKVSMVCLTVGITDRYISVGAMVSAILYAEEIGIPILNVSIGGGFSDALYDAIKGYSGLVVASAGNNMTNNDITPTYPASFNLENIISVAASNRHDRRTQTNVGRNTVHLAAPGEAIWTTSISTFHYGTDTGTSFAAPHVAGVAALLLSYNPNLTTQELRDAILNNVDIFPYWEPITITGGRLNAYRALSSVLMSRNALIAAGANYSLVLGDDNMAWASGLNNFSQLGGGDTENRSYLATVNGLDDVISVVAGNSHSLALTADGTVWAWGSNTFGELGIGLNAIGSYITTPQPVTGISGRVISIAAGTQHSLALTADGYVWAWGNNNHGQLDNQIPFPSANPIRIHIPSLSNVMFIAAGDYHNFAVMLDGTVWGWGRNDNGQVGVGSTTNAITRLTQITEISHVRSISAGTNHSLAVKIDGSVWAWGNNDNGQFGDNSVGSSRIPVLIDRLPNDIRTIVAGDSYSLALKRDGTVWAWGLNNHGQLGNNSTTSSPTPVQVNNLTNVTAIAASRGGTHNLALQADGTAWAWGGNTYGQLGDGSITQRLIPVQMRAKGIAGVILSDYALTLTAGTSITLTATVIPSFAMNRNVIWSSSDANVATVDENGVVTAITHGTAIITVTTVEGDFSADCMVTVVIAPLITSIAAGYAHSLVIDETGMVWSAGRNDFGQLGNQSQEYSSLLMPVSYLSNVVSVAAGNTHSLALTVDGEVWAWGSNTFGELGIGLNAIGSYITTPQPVTRIPGRVISIAAGAHHSLALTADGRIWAWGSSEHGQVGFDGTNEDILSPVWLQNWFMCGVTFVAAGAYHSFAIDESGTIWAWGKNDYGQLGLGHNQDYIFSPVMAHQLLDIRAIAGGTNHSLALRSDGSVWAWGNNDYGQLGNNRTEPSLVPVPVIGLTSGIRAIAAGDSYSLALASDGTIWAWGKNDNGQLGDGDFESRRIPTPVILDNLINATAIAVSRSGAHSLALKYDGTPWAWGNEDYGQLGTGNVGGWLPFPSRMFTFMATEITLSDSALILEENMTQTLLATVTPVFSIQRYMLGWHSSDIGVATVNSNGVVTAVSPGTATITVTNGWGWTAICEVTVVAGASPDITYAFTCANFLAAVRELIGKPTGPIFKDDVRYITHLNVRFQNISSLSGIEYFTGLTWLDFAHNQLTELDVSNNPSLRHLNSSSNRLRELDVSNNPALEFLNCNFNQLTELDVTNNPMLRELNCNFNQLTELDVSNNPVLIILNCFFNQLTELDVSNNPLLAHLDCSGNQLTELDLSNNPLLSLLGCSGNQLTELDLTNNPLLSHLDCSYNQLTELNLANNPALEYLNCSDNQLTELNLANNLALVELHVSWNYLEELDVTNNYELWFIDCSFNFMPSMESVIGWWLRPREINFDPQHI